MTKPYRSKESGNAVILVLVVLVVVAVGGMAYMSGQFADKERTAESFETPATVETASGEAVKAPAPTEEAEAEIKPGNPVVAKVGDRGITRMDVFNYMQTMPANMRQMPMDQLFPIVQNQVINMYLLEEKAKGVNLDNDPLVKEQLEAAKKQIVPVVFMQRQIDKAISEDRVKAAYDEYVKNFPELEEVHAKHILVDDESLAKDLIKQINDGASFEELAKANSKDSTADKGGDLGFFLKSDVVPEFGDAAFSQEIGVVSAEPVKTQYGYHIIKTEEKRMRAPASYEEAKPFLENQIRQLASSEILQKWRKDASVELYDINGDAIEPAAGEPAPETSAPEVAPAETPEETKGE